MVKGKKGFTLIELLAVIVILGIIATIITTSIVSLINNAKLAAYKETVHALFNSYQNYIYDKGIAVNNPKFNANAEELSYSSSFTGGIIFTNSDGITQVDGVTNDAFCAAGTLQNLEVVQGGCYQLDHTAPDDIDNIETSSTSSSILVTSHAYDAGSGIKSYEYFISSDGSTYNSVSCEKDKNVCLITPR